MSETKWILFGKRVQPKRWLFLVISIPFLLFALPNEYSTQHLALPGILCLIQFFVPTLAGWSVIIFGFALAVIGFAIMLSADVLRIFSKESPSIFLDFDDSVAVLIILGVLILVTILLYRARPQLKQPSDENVTGV